MIQVGNPLDFSKGMPPSLTVCNTDSLGEQTQREFPDARVVKALNTVNCEVMINPARVPGDHALPICGNDAQAKEEVAAKLSEWFGWKPSNIVDIGDITGARGTEMYLPLWLRLWGRNWHPGFQYPDWCTKSRNDPVSRIDFALRKSKFRVRRSTTRCSQR